MGATSNTVLGANTCICASENIEIILPTSEADGLENGEPYEKDGQLNLELKHNAYLALFFMANKSETES